MRWSLLCLALLSCCSSNTPTQHVSLPDPAPLPSHTEPVPVPVPVPDAAPPLPELSLNRVLPGESLFSILSDAQLDSAQRFQASSLLQPLMDINKIPADSAYTVRRHPDGKLRSLTFQLSPSEAATLEMGQVMSARLDRKPVASVTRKAQGKVVHSLHQTLVAAGHPVALASALQAVFGSRLNFKSIAYGTRFQILYSEQQVGGKSIGMDRILGARIQHGDKLLQAFLFDTNGLRYFDERGNALNGGFLFAPLETTLVSSPFSRQRFHPILKRNMPHLGTDYAASYGDPVMAVADGTVIEAQYSRYNGNYVKIKHDNVYQTQYLHMSSIAKKMEPGQKVKQGETIGFVGSTGLANGTHLCFRFWKNGRQVDPRFNRAGLEGKPAGAGFKQLAERMTLQFGPFPYNDPAQQLQADAQDLKNDHRSAE